MSSLQLIDSMGDDISVVNAARVSFDKESEWQREACEYDGTSLGIPALNVMYERDEKLLGYLARHNHWTPFGHCFASFRVEAPIYVARQLAKHQVGLVWNEVSRRYVDNEPTFTEPTKWKGRPDNAKQGAGEPLPRQDCYYSALRSHHDTCLKIYGQLLSEGVAPEQARMVLPLSTNTQWIWSGSMMAWARVCKLRLSADAQAETRDVVECIHEECTRLWPYSWGALMNETT